MKMNDALSGRELYYMFLAELIDEIKVLRIEISDSVENLAKKPFLMQRCDEMIYKTRTLMRSIDKESRTK